MTRVWLGLALALALTAPVAADPGPNISVNGEAEARVAPDIATLSLAVEAEQPTAEAAAADNARVAKAVVDGLKSGGVAADDLQTTGLSLFPEFASNSRKVEGYRASESFSVRIHALDKAGALTGAAVTSGALYRGLSFDVTDREARQDALRGAAVENARHRAELYAKGAGMKLGLPLAIVAEGATFSAPQPRVYAAALRAPAEPVIEAGLITLRDSVSVTFAMSAP